MSKPECGRVDCSTCPYPDCDPKYWPKKKSPESIAKRKEYARKYYEAHKEQYKASSAEWIKRNREHVRKYNTEYVRAWRARKKADNDSTGA